MICSCHELNHKSNINYQLQTVTNIISAIKTKRKLKKNKMKEDKLPEKVQYMSCPYMYVPLNKH